MYKTGTRIEFKSGKPQPMATDTPGLMEMLNSGRATAVTIGEAAGAKIIVGRRVLWNVSKIQKHLDEISE